MKIILLVLTLNYTVSTAFCQIACTNSKEIVSPVIVKPTAGSIISATCSALTVQWTGETGQTYTVTATLKDPVTHQPTPTAPATNVSCDNSQHCTAIIPVTAGTLVSWSVQAVGTIDGRTFYSYPLRGEQDYAIPACGQPMVTSKSPGANLNEQLVVSNEKLAMYPNPVSDAINIQWNSAYRGNVQLTIVDVSGNVVKVINGKKAQPDYTYRIPVSALTPGLYFVAVKMQDGTSRTARFLKN